MRLGWSLMGDAESVISSTFRSASFYSRTTTLLIGTMLSRPVPATS